ncbi:hypothetical protein [Streptomyces sp. S.PNR 29]|uniref:hypothetical protein n=1 Tax=Streptomyces sp. S.PNR 29 TaxID=2973805 RepID=UPI0025B16CCE|nr:hypothetical protein [Streptomyces sp. S.PNR 29]MDN0201102.1 hypothetical protein [Streptomyces sp. S.PNR 29]
METLRDRLIRCLPDLSAEMHAERSAITRHLIVQMVAEPERALADNTPTRHAGWRETASGLIDAVVAPWQAPVTRED